MAKATLYSTFGSKEGLIIAYLQARLESRQERTNAPGQGRLTRANASWVCSTCWTTHQRTRLPRLRVHERDRRVAARERGGRGGARSRAWTLSLFTDLARDVGAADPEALARQLMLLYDGALVSSHMDRDSKAADTAKVTAGALIDAAKRRRRPTSR